MMPNSKVIAKEIAAIALFEAVKASLFGFIAFAATYASGFSIPALGSHRGVVTAGGAIFGLAVMVYSYRKMNRHLPTFDKIDVDFRIVKKTISYEYISANEIIYRIQYEIKPLKNGLDGVFDRYKWSGKGRCDLKSGIPGHKIVHLEQERFYHFFEIRFDRPYSRKDGIIKTEAVWHLEDVDGTSHPVMAATIHEPTECLVMQLKLPSSQKISTIRRTVAPDAGSKCNVDSEDVPFENGVHTWSNVSPRLLHYYELRWRR